MSHATLTSAGEQTLTTAAISGAASQGDIIFQPAVPEHYQGIADLLLTKRELFRAHPAGKFPMTVEQVAELVDKRIEPTVMLADGQVVGFACFYRYRPAQSVFIGHVMIHPDLRRQGLGRQLVKHMVGLAFGKYDLPQVRVSILAENTTALLGCVRGGFRPYAVLERKTRRGKPMALLNLRLSRERFVPSEE